MMFIGDHGISINSDKIIFAYPLIDNDGYTYTIVEVGLPERVRLEMPFAKFKELTTTVESQ